MKQNYRKPFVFLCLIMWGVTGLAETPVYEVSGTVSDKVSGEFLENAKIYLVRDGEILIETSSNKDGSFTLKIAEDDFDLGGIKVQVRKNGYRTEIVNTAPGPNNQLRIQMVKSKTVPIMIPKKSPTGQYIIVHMLPKTNLKENAFCV